MTSSLVCVELEDAAVDLSYREDPFPEDAGGVELECLVHHALHEVFRENLSETGDIVDVLFGVEDGDLPTHLLKGVDQFHLHLPQPSVECSTETCWSRAYYPYAIFI